MGKKIYAIKEGFDSEKNIKVENRIVSTWAECLKYVKGVKGAKYKSFEDIGEAKEFLSDSNKLRKKEDGTYPQDCLHVYVDGSYNSAAEMYSYGLVAVKNGVIQYIESDGIRDASKKSIRQIAGELKGAVRASEYALENGESKVVIFHDYEGISHHATGFWDRKEPSSVEYYEKMNKLMKQGIEIIFVKVDSHTGDLFNEIVDEKCKEKAGITPTRVTEKWLLTNKLKVNTNREKDEVLSIAPSGKDNIIVIGEEEDNENFDILVFLIEEYKKDKAKCQLLINRLNDQEKDYVIMELIERVK